MSILTKALRFIVKRHFDKYPCASYTFFDYKNKIEYKIERNTDSVFFKIWKEET